MKLNTLKTKTSLVLNSAQNTSCKIKGIGGTAPCMLSLGSECDVCSTSWSGPCTNGEAFGVQWIECILHSLSGCCEEEKTPL
jgi:hypothetical protein